jgi:hypothetical protein
MALHHNPRIVTSGLVLALDAKDINSYPGSGTTWYDVSGNGYTGAISGAPLYTSNGIGSFYLDGTGDNIEVTNTTGLGTGGASPNITLSVMCNIERKSGGGTQFQSIAGFRDNADYDFFFLLLDSSGATVNTEARLRTAAGIYDINVDFTSYFGQWVQIDFVGSSNRSDLYLNSVLVGSNTSVTGAFGASTSNFRVGRDPSYPTFGYVSTVKIYNRALSASEIEQNYLAQKSRFGL